MVKSLVGIHVTINSELDEDILLTYTTMCKSTIMIVAFKKVIDALWQILKVCTTIFTGFTSSYAGGYQL